MIKSGPRLSTVAPRGHQKKRAPLPPARMFNPYKYNILNLKKR